MAVTGTFGFQFSVFGFWFSVSSFQFSVSVLGFRFSVLVFGFGLPRLLRDCDLKYEVELKAKN
jgi:hypothetical protein